MRLYLEDAPSKFKNVCVILDHGCSRNLEIFVRLVNGVCRAFLRVCTVQPIFLAVVDVEHNCPFRSMGREISDKLQESGDTHSVVGSARCS